MDFRRLTFFIHIVLSFIVLRVAAIFKVSYIIGSKMSFFSATDLVLPVIGASNGTMFVLSLFSLRFLVSGFNPIVSFLTHLPTLSGTLYWSNRSIVIRLLLPLLCIILFLIHPVGIQAYAYSFYWFIPIILYVINAQSIPAQALGATFVVHAVGSVIWLYTVPMDALQWWALIPIVAIERFVSAMGMIVVYYTYNLVSVYTKKALFSKALRYD